MATYTVKAPDGRTYTVKGPDGASDAQVIAAIKAKYPDSIKPRKGEPTGMLKGMARRFEGSVGNIMGALGELPGVSEFAETAYNASIAQNPNAFDNPEAYITPGSVREELPALVREQRAKAESVVPYTDPADATFGALFTRPLDAIPAIGEQAVLSLPSMLPYAAGPLIGMGATALDAAGDVAYSRADANKTERPTAADWATAAGVGAAVGALDRFGASRMLGPIAEGPAVQAFKEIPKAAGKAAVAEGATEAAQSAVQYGGSTIGTETPFSFAEAARQAEQGALIGGFMGAGVRTPLATIEAAVNGGQTAGVPPAQPTAPTAPTAPQEELTPWQRAFVDEVARLESYGIKPQDAVYIAQGTLPREETFDAGPRPPDVGGRQLGVPSDTIRTADGQPASPAEEPAQAGLGDVVVPPRRSPRRKGQVNPALTTAQAEQVAVNEEPESQVAEQVQPIPSVPTMEQAEEVQIQETQPTVERAPAEFAAIVNAATQEAKARKLPNVRARNFVLGAAAEFGGNPEPVGKGAKALQWENEGRNWAREFSAPAPEPAAIEPEPVAPPVVVKPYKEALGLGFKRDNPGGDWLANKQATAEKQMASGKETFVGRGLNGAVTGWMERVTLPSQLIARIPGAMGERPKPGTPKYDSLAKKVAEEGFKAEEHPILIAVNHKGEPFIVEGNNRVAVAASLGQPIVADVQWRNGAEEVDGVFSPDEVAKLTTPFIGAEPPAVGGYTGSKREQKYNDDNFKALQAEEPGLTREEYEARRKAGMAFFKSYVDREAGAPIGEAAPADEEVTPEPVALTPAEEVQTYEELAPRLDALERKDPVAAERYRAMVQNIANDPKTLLKPSDVAQTLDRKLKQVTRRGLLGGVAGAAVAGAADAATLPRTGLSKNATVMDALRTGSLQKSVEAIRDTSTNPGYRKLAAILAAGGLGDAKVDVYNYDSELNTLGETDPYTGDVEIYATTAGLSGLTEETILHEALHSFMAQRLYSVSVHSMESNRRKLGETNRGVNQFETAFAEKWRQLGEALEVKFPNIRDDDFDNISAYEMWRSPDELFVRVFTDPDARALLQSINMKGKDIRKGQKSWWDSLLDMLFGWLGSRDKQVRTAFDEVMNSADAYLKAAALEPANKKTAQKVGELRGRSENERYQMYVGSKAAKNNTRMGDYLETAKALEDYGNDSRSIQDQTEWARGPWDKQWRTEISDHRAVLLYDPEDMPRNIPMYLREVLDHQELYALYPEIEDTFVVIADLGRDTGYYNPAKNTIYVADSLDEDTFMDVLIHELQHVVQTKEGFAFGTSSEGVVKTMSQEQQQALREELFTRLMALRRALLKGAGNEEKIAETERYMLFLQSNTPENLQRVLNEFRRTANATYMRSAGEIEARDTAARRKLNEQDRRVVDRYHSEREYLGRDDVIVSRTGMRHGMASERLKQRVKKDEVKLSRGAKKVREAMVASGVDGVVDYKTATEVLTGIGENIKGHNADSIVEALKNTRLSDYESPVLKGLVKTLPTTGIVNWVGKELPALQRLKIITDKLIAQRNTLKRQFSVIGNDFAKFVRKNGQLSLANAMHLARLNNVAPDAFPDLQAALQGDKEIVELRSKLNNPNTDPDMIPTIKTAITNRQKQLRDVYKAWEKLAEQKGGQELYKRVRTYYKDMYNVMRALLNKRLDDLPISDTAKKNLMDTIRLQGEEATSTAEYFPFRRYGEYWLRIAHGPSGRQFHMFETAAERNAFLRKHAVENGITDLTSDQAAELYKAGDSSAMLREELHSESLMLQKLFSIIDRETKDGVTAEQLKDELYQTYLQTLPERSIRKQFIHADNVAGFSQDVLRNFVTSSSQYANQIARLMYSRPIYKTIEEGEASLDGMPPLEAAKLRTFLEEVAGRAQEQLNPNEQSAIVNTVNRAAFLWFLTSGATAATQMTALPIRVLPRLQRVYGFAKASKMALRYSMVWNTVGTDWSAFGSKEFIGPSVGDAAFVKNNPLLAAAFKAGRDERSVYETSVGTILDNKPTPKTATGSKIAHVSNELLDATTALFGASERITREIAYMMAFELEYEKTGSFDEAVNRAVEHVEETLGNYTDFERPSLVKGDLGRMVFLFKMYAVQLTKFFVQNTMAIARARGNVVTNAEARSAALELANVLLTGALFHGLAGMPLYSVISATINALLNVGDDEEDKERRERNPLSAQSAEYRFRYEFLPELFGENMVPGLDGKMHRLSDVIMNGAISELSDVNVGSRTTFDGVWFRQGQGDTFAQQFASTVVANIAGVSLGNNFAMAVDDFERGDVQRGVEKILPAFLRAPVSAYRLATEGAETRRGDDMLSQDEISDWNLAMQVVGFQPTQLSQLQKQRFDFMKLKRSAERERTNLLGRWNRARTNPEGNERAIRRVLEDMVEYNKKYPMEPFRITGDTLSKSAKNYDSKTEQTIRGTLLDNKDIVKYAKPGIEAASPE